MWQEWGVISVVCGTGLGPGVEADMEQKAALWLEEDGPWANNGTCSSPLRRDGMEFCPGMK